MNNECERVRKALPKYLQGHVFRMKRNRIERHLEQCIMCRSECESLRRIEETKQLLRDIDAADGMAGRVRDGISAIGKARRVFYRPLWIAGIALLAGAAYYYAVMPRQLDLEIERIVTSTPTSSVSTSVSATHPAVRTAAVATAGTATATTTATTSKTTKTPSSEPFVILITPENDKTGLRKINEALHGTIRLRNMNFTETVQEITGTLTAGELTSLFSRLERTAKITYRRGRLESLAAADPVPFVMRLKPSPQPAEPRVSHPEPKPEAKPEPKPAAKPEPKPSAADSSPTVSAP